MTASMPDVCIGIVHHNIHHHGLKMSDTATKISSGESPFSKHFSAQEAGGEVVGEAGQDKVPALRSSSSAKSILKQSSSLGSGELATQDSEPKVKRAVSWHDFEGKHLHTVREFVPSEHDGEELLFNPGEAKQCCVIC